MAEPAARDGAGALKTRPGRGSVDAFLAQQDPARRADCDAVVALMREATGCEPVLWGPSIVGFDTYTYRYESGREGDWLIVGFSPRKQALTLYIMPGFDAYEALLARLGKFSTGKSCLYLKRLADVDMDVLRELVVESVAAMRARYPRNA